MTYDGLDRQKRWIFPSKTSPGLADHADYEEYGYDENANRTSLRKRDGGVLNYQYDPLNRMFQKTVPASAGGASGYSVFYGLDNRGLAIHARFGSASGPGVTNVYDGFGLLASSTTNMDGTARTLSSQYDLDGNRTHLSGDSGYNVGFGHDGLGRMKAYEHLARIGYDSAGRRSSLGFGPWTDGSSATYGYDPAGRLDSLDRALAGTSADQSLTFGYNPASQIATRSSSNEAYASNAAYNVSRAYAVNGQNQYTAAGPAAFAYDSNGNLTSDGSTNFVYDSENRLVSASGAKNASLAYDPLGRLWQVAGAASGTTRFLYDGDRLVMEYGGSGNLLRAYVHGTGTDEPLAWYEMDPGGWSRRYYHSDHQGSIVALADDSGNPVAINAYDPWGIPNAGNLGRFGYTGQTWMPELGLWYYKARFYSPTLGRFMQTDPIGYDDQMNLYAYVGNDPLNKTDPDGECEVRTGSNICEATRKITFSIKNGDEVRIYNATVATRDGYVFNTRFFASEGVGGSFSPLDLIPAGRMVSAVAKVGDAIGLRSLLGVTQHGAVRTGLAGAGRGGTLTYAQSVATRLSASRILTQADGARVFIRQVAGSRFNVVVSGDRGVITTFRGLSQRSVDRLSTNYGWH